jgi:hypothetical protein
MADAELRLSEAEPEVERWPAEPDRFIVKFAVEGFHAPELEGYITRHVESLGVDSVRSADMTFTLYGVQRGREAETLAAVEAAIAEFNKKRREAAEEWERERPAREKADAAAEAELEAVRDAFRSAQKN